MNPFRKNFERGFYVSVSVKSLIAKNQRDPCKKASRRRSAPSGPAGQQAR
jgi:hypothetical protein